MDELARIAYTRCIVLLLELDQRLSDTKAAGALLIRLHGLQVTLREALYNLERVQEMAVPPKVRERIARLEDV